MCQLHLCHWLNSCAKEMLRFWNTMSEKCIHCWYCSGCVGAIPFFLLSFYSSIVVGCSSFRSYCIIRFYSFSNFFFIFDCTRGCRFLFAFLCYTQTVFVFTVSHDLHSQWSDVVCSFAHNKKTKGCIEPDRCQHIYVYLPAYRFSACLEPNRYHSKRREGSLSFPSYPLCKWNTHWDANGNRCWFSYEWNACTRANRFLASIVFHEIYLFVMIMGFIRRNMNNNFLFKFIFYELTIQRNRTLSSYHSFSLVLIETQMLILAIVTSSQ